VMGTNSQAARERESQRLLSYGFRYFETHRLFDGGSELYRTRVWKGKAENIGVGVAENIYQTIPRGMHDRLEASLDVDQFVTAPIESGTRLGELVVKLEGEELLRAPLVALEEVDSGGLLRRLWHSIMMFVLGLFN
jgi:serine-type D-Ala-D-Ala carboxypeptidase (penicillin-binding protein 5/6)